MNKWEEPPDTHNEADFRRAVMTLFRKRGWRVNYNAPRPADKGRYITTGDPGFPDLTLLRPPDLWYLELKHVGARKARKDSEHQRLWINGIMASGSHAYVVDEGYWALLVDIARDGLKVIEEEEHET